MHKLNLALIAFAIVAGVSSLAQASTINYTFTQNGFTDSAGDTGTLSGSFTATPEANGSVQLGDLVSFSATFQETVNGTPDSFLFVQPNDFYFDPNTDGSLNFSTGSTASGIIACSGSTDVNAVCEGLTNPIGPRTSSVGFFEDLPVFGASTTREASVVNVNGGGAAAPEPGSSILLATGVALIFVGSLIKRWARKTRLCA